VENGTADSWNELFSFLQNNDLTGPDNWAFVESRIDIDSVIDFAIIEGWSNNTSWTGNREIWKAHRPGAKWRWFIPDMDRTFSSISNDTLGSMLDSEQSLRYLKDNDSFRNRLAQRYAAHLTSTLSVDRLHSIIDETAAAAEPEIDRTDQRWDGAPSLSDYRDRVEALKDYSSDRAENALEQLAENLDISNPVELTLNVVGNGNFRVNGVTVPPGTHKFFPDIDSEVVAIPAPGFRFESWEGIDATGTSASFNINSASTITANFVPANTPALGGTLTADLTLSDTTAPYLFESDLIIPAGITVTLNPGVTLEPTTLQNIRVFGTLNIAGTEEAPVTIQGRNGATWGGISFEEPSTTSTLSHLIIRNGSRGADPTVYPSTISGLNADLDIEFLDIQGTRGPLFFRGGNLSLRDSLIDIPVTGDGINIKKGAAETIRCTFTGNDSPDTDAIDYDGVVNGLIKDCRIYNFLGFNSDAIDTGEQCVNVLIEGNSIFFNSDKGISVGQGSTVVLRRNLIVGCPLGVGVKDTGSQILVDQNTFVDCDEGVSVYEKNFGGGGGAAIVTNSIFSDCTLPVTVDQYSTLSVSYSLSDNIPISGANNLLGSPLFTDPATLNFELLSGSPAINSGDPTHELDPDGSQADIGALYLFSPDDYPFSNSNTVVINEILANSGNQTDWIELHNRTLQPINIGGWFLSDDASNLAKYQLPSGTIIPANGYLIFYEDSNFGTTSIDPGRFEGFALSDTGETVYLSAATDGQLTGYRFKEDFGPSIEGESIGYYFKSSSNSYNFVAQDFSTQAGPNSSPKVGPVVISEIMYNPSGDGDAEYIELQNITPAPITLFDGEKNLPWKFSDGIEFEFPSASPLTLSAGQRIILTRNLNSFTQEFTTPEGTLVLEWITGRLSNGGETLQLVRPGPLDDLGNPSFVRVDRVNYSPDLPWDIGADGSGLSLTRDVESSYGNDFINWTATAPTPGTIATGSRFTEWASAFGIDDPSEDPDQDGLTNLMEYALGTDPSLATSLQPISTGSDGNRIEISFPSSYLKPDLNVTLEVSNDLQQWSTVPTSTQGDLRTISVPRDQRAFYRLHVALKP
ncbi:lamin tail domain-containing protein, partial [Akkermansiaceae bacterium]|nr:lamin tail domain-containing protein [Akkermansiaceae bacterium]